MLPRLQNALRQMFLPNGLLVICVLAALWFVPRGADYPSGARWVSVGTLLAAVLLALRLHSLRAFLAGLSLAALLIWLIFGGAAPGALRCAIELMVIDVVAIALLVDDAFFDWIAVLWWSAFLAVEWLTFVALIHWAPPLIQAASNKTIVSDFGTFGLLETITAVALLALLIRFAFKSDAVGAGLFWTVVSLVFRRPAAAELYVALAGMVIAVAVIERSHWIAYHDELTGLPGRRGFNEALAAVGQVYAIAVVDVDHFKQFNDTYGHDTGDQVLRNVASHLARVPKGKGYRCGGEEFAVVYDGLTADEAVVHAERLRRSIEEDVFVVRGPARSARKRTERRAKAKLSRRGKAVETNVTVSIGVAEARGQSQESEDVVKAADKALYAAKEQGRNRVEVYAPPTRANRVEGRKIHAQSRAT